MTIPADKGAESALDMALECTRLYLMEYAPPGKYDYTWVDANAELAALRAQVASARREALERGADSLVEFAMSLGVGGHVESSRVAFRCVDKLRALAAQHTEAT